MIGRNFKSSHDFTAIGRPPIMPDYPIEIVSQPEEVTGLASSFAGNANGFPVIRMHGEVAIAPGESLRSCFDAKP